MVKISHASVNFLLTIVRRHSILPPLMNESTKSNVVEISTPTESEIIARLHATIHLIQREYEAVVSPVEYRLNLVEATLFGDHWMNEVTAMLELSAPYARECNEEIDAEGVEQ